MNRAQLKASLALWRRRHAWRQRRLDAAHKANDKVRIVKWHKLLTEAGAVIRRRENQLATPKPFHPLEGIDYAWGKANVQALKRAGIRFACRYLSHDAAKNLTHAEAKALSAAGIDVVVVWETTANRASAGKQAGMADAREADRQAHACGMPASKPIYFAVDFDGNAAQVSEYFRGVNAAIGVKRTGVYGGVRVVKGLLDAHLVTYAWQTYAWSGGVVEKRAHVYQYSNGHRLAGVSCDFDRAMHPDFGQWRAR
jgi:Domain of unknown function (DUF1906)